MMFLLTTSLLTVVLTVVVGSEYYSGLPTVANKHFYEYGGQTNDAMNARVDDTSITMEGTHPIIFFGESHSHFTVNSNGYAWFGPTGVYAIRLNSIPYSSGDGSDILVLYSTDLAVGGVTDCYLSYRVDRSEHTLLRATADVIDRYPADASFRAAEVFIITWHRISIYPGDDLVRMTFQLVVISDGVGPGYAIYNYGEDMTIFHNIGVGVQHHDASSNNHYQYNIPQDVTADNGASVNPIIGQRFMFKLVVPLTRPQDTANVECARDTWSHNYRQPCLPCPSGWYQNDIGQMYCRNCQDLLDDTLEHNEMMTDSLAVNQPATTLPLYCMRDGGDGDDGGDGGDGGDGDDGGDADEETTTLCSAGSFSVTGSDPGCSPCNIGSYQPITGQTSCTPCGNGQTTIGTGSTLSSQCYSTSTVVGDPHFMITDPRSKEHFCFDYGGDDGENLVLVDDTDSDISVSGILFEVIPNSHQTYFSTVEIRFEKRTINFSKTAIMVEEEMLSWSLDSVVVFDGLVVRPLVERVDAVLVELMGGDVSAVVTRHHDQIGYFLGIYLVETNGLSKHAKGLLGQFVHHEWTVNTRRGNSFVTVQLESGDVTVPVKQVPRFSPTSHSRLMCWLYESESDATNLLFQRAEIDARAELNNRQH